jgi:solute carrier family 25 phosphate transporter 3
MESKRSSMVVPDFLYSPRQAVARSSGLAPSSSGLFQALTSEAGTGSNAAFTATSLFRQVAGAARSKEGVAQSFMVPAASEGKIVMFSGEYYRACAVGGMLCCGLTHMGVTPIDVVKCNMQIAPQKYKSITGGFSLLVKEHGAVGLFRGWAPTLLGYSVQGACKYGFYEYFKKTYSDMAGPENAKKYKTLIYLAGSASAEVIADVGLCPFEAVKVRVQTNPGYAKGLTDGLPKLLASDGVAGLYKGLVPLWGRQIPYTMMKFATFESTVEAIYKYVVPVPKSEVSSGTQLGISFSAGYIAGVACAIISHPADNLVSFLNNAKGATVSQAVNEMGMKALFTRGLPLRIIMIGTLTGAQWGIYDSFKVFVGLPTTGGVVVEEPKAQLA